MKANAELRARRLATWQQAQALYDRMNDPLSERYRKQFQDRGYGEGFSRQERSESDVREDIAAGRLVRVLGGLDTAAHALVHVLSRAEEPLGCVPLLRRCRT